MKISITYLWNHLAMDALIKLEHYGRLWSISTTYGTI